MPSAFERSRLKDHVISSIGFSENLARTVDSKNCKLEK